MRKRMELVWYAVARGVVEIVCRLVWRVRMPDLAAENRRAAREERKRQSLWHHPNLVWGVPAIFIYLIAEIGIGSTLVNFISLPQIGAMSHADAANYLTLFWGGAMAVDALALFPSSPMKTALEQVVAFCLARTH